MTDKFTVDLQIYYNLWKANNRIQLSKILSFNRQMKKPFKDL
jgi:hypothetical protein